MGKYTWKDKRQYEGEWLNNKMHGNGVFVWQDGRRYEGEYKNNQKDGKGVYKWSCGRVYHGEWKNGKQHGIGKIRRVGEDQYKTGVWEKGKLTHWKESDNVTE